MSEVNFNVVSNTSNTTFEVQSFRPCSDGMVPIDSIERGYVNMQIDKDGNLLLIHHKDDKQPDMQIVDGELIYEFN